MALKQQTRGERPEARGRTPLLVTSSLQPPASGLGFDWSGRRVTVMGLGRHGGGVAAVRYLAERGARVTISDLADRATLAGSLSKLDGVPIVECKSGGHDPADFRTQFVVVNPAVRPDHSCLQIARDAGARLTSETELFLTACPARVVGVTGSNGKTTTCSMLAAILSAAGLRTWLGGNIGRSLLGDLASMTRDDWVVLEISSFQLAHLSASARLPEIAVVTNCSANHLDWHGSFADYARAKQRLLAMQHPDRLAIVNEHDPVVAKWTESIGCRTAASWPLEYVPVLRVPGEHNRQNAACAAAAAAACRIERDVVNSALARFQGLPHRLEFVAEVVGRRIYNDSKSTSPGATVAALQAIDGPTWLLAGGHSKGATFDELSAAIVERACGAAVFGAARHALQSSIARREGRFKVCAFATMDQALAWCWRQSRVGDAIVLSPACASHDQYLDYHHRGETFRALVRELSALAVS